MGFFRSEGFWFMRVQIVNDQHNSDSRRSGLARSRLFAAL